MQYKYVIPSYHRYENQITLNYLKSIGVSGNDIYIYVQDEDDYKLYTDMYCYDCNIVYKIGKSVSDNRNNILDSFHVGDWLVMIDDDVSSIAVNNNGCLEKIWSSEVLSELFDGFFRTTKECGSHIWGLYPVPNSYFMNGGIKYYTTVNTVIGIIVSEQRFYCGAKEDIEMCCRMIDRGEKVLRFDDYTYFARHRTMPGGCYDAWHTNADEIAVQYLLEHYPGLVAPKSGNNKEIRFIYKSR